MNGTSNGTQEKFCDGKYWYKIDQRGYEGLTEYLASRVLSCSNVSDYVSYELCDIRGKSGCKSINFLAESESFFTFDRIFQMYRGRELMDSIMHLSSPQEKIDFVKTIFYEITDVDITEYLSQTLSLDMLLLNTDRHFNNLGMIYSYDTKKYRTAPVFDNGAGLLSDILSFPLGEDIMSNIEKVYGKPFSANLELQAYYAGFSLKIDMNEIIKILLGEPNSRAKEVLLMQLEKYKKILGKEPQ